MVHFRENSIIELPPKDLKRPAEFFGVPFEEDDIVSRVKQGEQDFSCPFRNGPCIKKRHNIPTGGRVKSGVCSVWYNHRNYITCAERHLEGNLIFEEASRLIFKPRNKVLKLNEVGIGSYGRFDFLVANVVEALSQSVRLLDWFALETVSIDTTSTRNLNNAVSDRIKNSLNTHYHFGLNFEHTLKLMIPQVIFKGTILETWGKRYVWVVQDGFWDYVERQARIDVDEGVNDNSIIIYVVKLMYNQDTRRLTLQPCTVKSTTVSRFRGSIKPQAFPDQSKFLQKIKEKISKEYGLTVH